MSTFDQLTQIVLANLQGFSLDQDQITYLTSGITASDTTLAVNDSAQASRGMVEIDDEIVWVQQIDALSGSISVPPQGRGWIGSTAASHSSGAIVHNNPKYPKVIIKRAINDVIRSTFPKLFQVKSSGITYSASRTTYGIPAEAEDIYDLTWEAIGPSRQWPRLPRWRFVPNADLTDYPTGKAVEVLEPIVPGRSIQVTYLKAPQPLVSGSDEFSTVSGLQTSAEDVVIYGACYRLSGYLDIPRLQTQNIEGTSRSQLVPPGAAVNASKYFYALHQERLQQEREMLLSRYPRVTHKTRR